MQGSKSARQNRVRIIPVSLTPAASGGMPTKRSIAPYSAFFMAGVIYMIERSGPFCLYYPTSTPIYYCQIFFKTLLTTFGRDGIMPDEKEAELYLVLTVPLRRVRSIIVPPCKKGRYCAGVLFPHVFCISEVY